MWLIESYLIFFVVPIGKETPKSLPSPDLQIPKGLVTEPLVDIVLDRGDGQLDGLVGRLQDLVAARKPGQDVAVGLGHGTIKADLGGKMQLKNFGGAGTDPIKIFKSKFYSTNQIRNVTNFSLSDWPIIPSIQILC